MEAISAEKYKKYTEEILRQISFQSSIIGGFAYTGLTQVSFQNSHPLLERLFSVSSTASICLEILALFSSGCLLFVSAASNINEEKWKTQAFICWCCYGFGLIAFLISVLLIPWVADRNAKIITIAIVAVTIGAGVGWFWWIAQTTQKKAGP